MVAPTATYVYICFAVIGFDEERKEVGRALGPSITSIYLCRGFKSLVVVLPEKFLIIQPSPINS